MAGKKKTTSASLVQTSLSVKDLRDLIKGSKLSIKAYSKQIKEIKKAKSSKLKAKAKTKKPLLKKAKV